MNFNDKLTQSDIENIKENNEYKKLAEEAHNNENIYIGKNVNEVEYFDVLTDGYHFWVSIVDMEKICTQISVSSLQSIGVKLDTDVVFGETYVNVNDEFLIYVQRNTNNPRYVPRLGLLATKHGDYDYDGTIKEEIASSSVKRVDGQTEEVYNLVK